jgi:hypothetical protein
MDMSVVAVVRMAGIGFEPVRRCAAELSLEAVRDANVGLVATSVNDNSALAAFV